jgi:hypothetical protein
LTGRDDVIGGPETPPASGTVAKVVGRLSQRVQGAPHRFGLSIRLHSLGFPRPSNTGQTANPGRGKKRRVAGISVKKDPL